MKTIIALMALILGSGQINAATMTFDALPPASFNVPNYYVEEGITVTGTGYDFGYWGVPETYHLDDAGTPLGSSAIFTMSGDFTPVSLDILSLGLPFGYNDSTGTFFPETVTNVEIVGFKDGNQVFFNAINSGPLNNVVNYTFSSTGPLDTLRVSTVVGASPSGLGECQVSGPCNHFNIDNVVLAPVPLPPAFLMLLGALLAPVYIRRKQPARA